MPPAPLSTRQRYRQGSPCHSSHFLPILPTQINSSARFRPNVAWYAARHQSAQKHSSSPSIRGLTARPTPTRPTSNVRLGFFFLLSAAQLGCQKTPVHLDPKPNRLEAARQSTSTSKNNSPFVEAAASAPSGQAPATLELPSCLSGHALPSDIARRLAYAEEQCLTGMRRIWSSAVVRFESNGNRKLGQHRLDTPSCVRLVAVSTSASAALSVTLRDDQGQVLAESQGQLLVVAPAAGPLCVPQATDVFIDLSAEGAPPHVQASLLSTAPLPTER